MTIAQIAASEPFRAELQKALDNNAIRVALAALERKYLPTFKIKTIQGMTATEAASFEYARICGAQEVLATLRNLPLTQSAVQSQIASAIEDLGQPWEYLAKPEEESKSVTKPTKKK